ncbi:MAG: DNA gyrase subunit A [Nitrospinota bacterium]|nr:DNA gyrase subunit A [Nitrospinota bacterium]MDH5678735.1 DNA gyrase subunit A [Nitrospinota bacterium]
MEEIHTGIVPIDIEDEMKSSFLAYSMSVIVSRALPDVRDGLKPVHRRILYAMNELGNVYNKPHKKSAQAVGEVMGKYHPHGDAAIYDTMVRMAQDFSLRYQLVDGQGNFGSVDGDPPAAMRYTEARLSRISAEMLADMEKETVQFVPNYDESLTEPTVLPSKLPNLLVNGSGGIAVGMTTNIPPHNLREVVAGVIHYIDNPDCAVVDLMEFIKGPDFPTGAEIHGEAGIRAAYATGRGHVVMRANAVIEPMAKGDREKIVITEIPYQVNKARLVKNIADLAKEKKILGLGEIRDESSRKGMRIVIELKKDAPARVILNQLYKHTQMQDTFGVIMIALVDGRPRQLNLKEMIKYFVEHRRRVVTAAAVFDLRKAREKEHILAGYMMALDRLDEVIAFIRAAENPETARHGLMEKFALSEIQAKAILELRLQRLTAMEREKIAAERAELLNNIARLEFIRDNESEKFKIIKEEVVQLAEQFGDERRTVITPVESEVDIEDLIPEEDVAVTVSMSGYIKRNPVDEYRAQKRGGKGVKGMKMQEEDQVQNLFVASTHDNILFFTSAGRVFRKKVYEIPSASRQAKGKAVVNLLQLQQEEKVATLFPLREFSEDRFLVIATRKGYIKKTSLDAFSRIHQGGIIAAELEEGDDVIAVSVSDGRRHVVINTGAGMAIRFSEEDIRPMGRTARGVRAITLQEDDVVVGMTEFDPEKDVDACLFSIKEDGYGKRSELDKYPLQRRGGKGVLDIKCDDSSGKVVAAMKVSPDDDLMTISQNGVMIRSRASDVSIIGRNTKGVRIMGLDEGDKVVAVSALEEQEQEEITPDETVQ